MEIEKTKIIAEIGINHNGDIDIAKKLIDVASVAGCDYVKFQKRNPDLCVPDSQKNIIKSTPWGNMTYLEYKKRIEFQEIEFNEISSYCKEKNIGWFCSVWDKDSVDFMKKYDTNFPPENKYHMRSVVMKIPSALITDIELCKYARRNCDSLIISTGMSNENQIDMCVTSCKPDIIMHTNSTYPCPINQLNLDYITWLYHKYNKIGCEIGYSGHEFGLTTTVAATLLGAKWIERHITLDRSMWGSDQIASVEPQGLIKLVKSIRDIETARGGYGKREILGSELEKMKSLRK
jgi:N-acetylneuraminate synthase